MSTTVVEDEVDEFGFYLHRRCPHCGANYYRSEGRPLCLNACDLPVWQYQKMNKGLREARQRVEARESGNDH